jgi:peptidoglycan/LPS O-acetylase OafA/YrhL
VPTAIRWPSLPTLADRFSSRANSIGFLRLVLAGAVLVSHSWPLGLGRGDPGRGVSTGQTDLGQLGVYGFFVLSGFLITASGLRFTLPRYAWHRFLRIFPGFWVCLLVTAFVIAPLVALYERGTLDGFWTHPQGPFSYVQLNWFTGIRQYVISDLLAGTPYGRILHGPAAFDGSLWSLLYELCCYLMVGALAGTAVLGRAPRAVVLLTVMVYAVIVRDFLLQPGHTGAVRSHGGLGPYPLIGMLSVRLLIELGFLFLLGMVAQLYKHRLPMHPALGVAAAVVFLASARFGGFYVVGLPAYAYLLLWAACGLPARLHGVGRRRDYSYGIYIYAFPVQQVIALLGGERYGVGVFILLAALGTVPLAVLSWHLVERPAMSLKDWQPRGRRRAAPAPAVAPATPPPPEPAPVAQEPAPERAPAAGEPEPREPAPVAPRPAPAQSA